MSLLRGFYHACRGAVITIPWLAQLLVADGLLSVLLPVSPIFPSLTYNISSRIAYSVWGAIQLIFTRFNSARITISGSSIPYGESAIVVANHVSWTDFYTIQELALHAGMLGRCRWFAKKQLKWVPFLGWGLWAMGMPLVSRNWVRDRAELDEVFGRIIRNQWPIWLISYSEATRYSRGKYEQTVSWCKENDKPVPQHTLYPRTKGFVATVSELRHAGQVKAVYDCTIGYAHGKQFLHAPTFWQSLYMPAIGNKWKIHIHVDRYLLEELPHRDEHVAQWLEDRWVEKGARLDHWRDNLARTGSLID